MFRQDGYPVREFCRFNFVYHYREPKRAKSRLRLIRGVGILARPQSGGKLGKMGAIYLTSICGVADNKGLFYGVPVSLLA
jgi:hypothetical protein